MCQGVDNVWTLGGTLSRAGRLDLLAEMGMLSVSSPRDQLSDLKRGA